MERILQSLRTSSNFKRGAFLNIEQLFSSEESSVEISSEESGAWQNQTFKREKLAWRLVRGKDGEYYAISAPTTTKIKFAFKVREETDAVLRKIAKSLYFNAKRGVYAEPITAEMYADNYDLFDEHNKVWVIENNPKYCHEKEAYFADKVDHKHYILSAMTTKNYFCAFMSYVIRLPLDVVGEINSYKDGVIEESPIILK